MLKRTLASAELVLAIVVTGRAQARSWRHRIPRWWISPSPRRRTFEDVERGFWLSNLWDLMTRREDYVTTRPLGVEGNKQVLFNVTVIVRSVLLKHAVEPALHNLALAFAASLFIAIFLGSVLPNVVLDPLQRVSRSIDLIRTGQFDTASFPARRESREFADCAFEIESVERAIPRTPSRTPLTCAAISSNCCSGWRKACCCSITPDA